MHTALCTMLMPPASHMPCPCATLHRIYRACQAQNRSAAAGKTSTGASSPPPPPPPARGSCISSASSSEAPCDDTAKLGCVHACAGKSRARVPAYPFPLTRSRSPVPTLTRSHLPVPTYPFPLARSHLPVPAYRARLRGQVTRSRSAHPQRSTRTRRGLGSHARRRPACIAAAPPAAPQTPSRRCRAHARRQAREKRPRRARAPADAQLGRIPQGPVPAWRRSRLVPFPLGAVPA
jgi:hypothetical protein